MLLSNHPCSIAVFWVFDVVFYVLLFAHMLGSYCPASSDLPIACDPGTYSDELGLSVCKQCPEGYYCLSGVDSFVDTPCPKGKYNV